MSKLIRETVTDVHHWNDTLFSFKTTRDQGMRFKNGFFTMIGLEVEDKPLLRAYSIASANYEEQMEFFSIKVPTGLVPTRISSPTFKFCSRDVKGPSCTLMLKNSICSS